MTSRGAKISLTQTVTFPRRGIIRQVSGQDQEPETNLARGERI